VKDIGWGERNALAGFLAGLCPDRRPTLHRLGQVSGAANDYVERPSRLKNSLIMV
jgi:hypothetical protein